MCVVQLLHEFYYKKVLQYLIVSFSFCLILFISNSLLDFAGRIVIGLYGQVVPKTVGMLSIFCVITFLSQSWKLGFGTLKVNFLTLLVHM